MASIIQWSITLQLVVLFAFNPSLIGAMRCSLIPEGVITPRSRIDANRYEIFVSGQPKGYSPGETYTIYIRNGPRAPIERNFRKFIFVLEHEEAEMGYSEDQADRVGSLAVIDALTTFNKKCRNSIIETNDLPKPEVRVTWTAPESGSGCVIFKASIVEATKQWFSDDDLVKKLCEQNEGSTDVQPDVLERCTACTEAKYEVTFEGLWSRNTFPHNFPDDAWKTRFSDVIGASHSDNYDFWSYYGRASEALRELAENGNTAPIEDDLKVNDESIRTIIKAKGLSYPNTTGRTYAAFRVDKNRHLMSLVASIIPSPDWFVGVSKYELCKEDGSWLESAIYNLYPWDAGTDAGITYTDPDISLNPGHPIRRIQSNSPNDERSPFYNNEGEDVKPLARIYITRQKVYEKECEVTDESQTPTEDVPNENEEYRNEGENESGQSNEKKQPDNGVQRRYKPYKCATSKFVEATSCSVTCGTGFKAFKRDYLNEEDQNDELCKEQLFKRVPCVAPVKICPATKYLPKDDPLCGLGEWGNFSSCSTNCGVGTKTRSRKYVHLEYEEACEANPDKESTIEDVECYGSEDNCENLGRTNTDCHYGMWTKCNVTCGTGSQARYLIPEGNFDECPGAEVVECYEPPCSEDAEEEEAFMPKVGSLVVEGSHLPIVNCKVSQWSSWSRCRPHSGTCGDGLQKKSRRILKHASNGGRRCPRLFQTRPCTKRCKTQYSTIDPLQANWGPANPNEITIDCVVSDWSAWGPCTQTCNPGGMQFRTKTLIMAPNKNGKPCPNVVDYRACVGLPNCR